MNLKTTLKMSLKTSLLLSAIFPIVFVGCIFVLLKLRLGTVVGSNALDSGFVVLLLVVGGAMSVQIIWYSRELLQKIRTLNKWSYSVLKGNLDHSIDVGGDDEVARLAKTLSKMLKELKEAYSSLQTDLPGKNSQPSLHQQGVQASQEAVRRLTDTLAQLRESQESLVQRERASAMEQVVRGVAHDFSEVMVPILGTCDHLLGHPEELGNTDGAVVHIKAIQESALRAKKLLRNLAGIFPAPQEIQQPAEASAAIKEAIRMAQPSWADEARAQGRPVEMKTNLHLVPPAAVESSDLRDAVVNLILNSVEAMPTGGTIKIDCRCDESLVVVEVADSGKGMPEDVRKRSVEPFFSTKEGAGKGMGLTMVDAMVRRYKGSLTIDSEKGMGTRVSMSFPLWTRKAQGYQEQRAEEKLKSKLRIIVVDDDWMSRKTVARALESQEHAVETAENGNEGLEKIKLGTFDVAIIDRAMPGMSGDELAAGIKKVKADMPVVMLTGFGDIMIQEGDLPAYVDTVLAKPVTIDDLHRGLVNALTPKPARTDRTEQKKPMPATPNLEAKPKGGSVKWID